MDKVSGSQVNSRAFVSWDDLSDVQMVSFDVFDTLIFRRSGTPHDFFAYLAQTAIKQGLWTNGDPDAFIQLRIKAESKARKNKFEVFGHHEVTLREVYDAWGQVDAEKMHELETNLELADWRINDAMVSWICELYKARVRLAILSDMYLDRKAIVEFLSRYIPTDWFEVVWVSGEMGCSKHDGGLFQKLIQRSNLQPDQILHVGDNPITDGQMAKAYKLNSFTSDFNYINTLTRYERRLTPFAPFDVDALRKQWVWKYPESSMVNQIGALIYGPFLYGFGRWLLNRCNSLGIKQIFCLLREGDLLAEVLNTIDDGSIQISTLAISRRASWLPSLSSIDLNVLHKLSQRRAYTLAECLEDLNLPVQDNWQQELSRELESLVSTPLWAELQQLFIERLDDIKQHLEQQRAFLVEYLSQQGVTNSSEIALVDWGCGASLFTNICSVIPLTDVSFFMAYASDKSLSFALDFALESFLPGGDHRAQVIAASPEVSEILLNGELCSTRTYEQTQAGIVPVPVTAGYTLESQQLRLKEFRHGVLSFCYLSKQLAADSYGSITNAQRAAFSAMLYRFVQYPLTEEAKVLAKMPVPLSSISHRALISSESISDMDKSFVHVGNAYEGISLGNYKTNSTSSWLPGTLALAFPDSTGLYGELAVIGSDDIVAPMLLQQLKSRNIKRSVIYGAGELGVKVLKLLTENGIEISNFVDRRATTGSFIVEGINVITLKQAMAEGERIFAIASRAYVNEITQDIIRTVGKDIDEYAVCLISGTLQRDKKT